MVRENRKEKLSNKELGTVSKEILELLKGLLKKIMSHLELPEPSGMHRQLEEKREKMENN